MKNLIKQTDPLGVELIENFDEFKPKVLDFGIIEIAAEDLSVGYNWYEYTNMAARLGEGWRLPTLSELIGIWESGKAEKYGFRKDWYWSASANSTSGTFGAWYVLFGSGAVTSYYKTNTYNRARCVRSIKRAERD